MKNAWQASEKATRYATSANIVSVNVLILFLLNQAPKFK